MHDFSLDLSSWVLSIWHRAWPSILWSKLEIQASLSVTISPHSTSWLPSEPTPLSSCLGHTLIQGTSSLSSLGHLPPARLFISFIVYFWSVFTQCTWWLCHSPLKSLQRLPCRIKVQILLCPRRPYVASPVGSWNLLALLSSSLLLIHASLFQFSLCSSPSCLRAFAKAASSSRNPPPHHHGFRV